MKSDSEKTSTPWYQQKGENEDVVVSSRCRLARNLPDFPFPFRARQEEKERIQSLVFDAATKTGVEYKFMNVNSLAELTKKAYSERGICVTGTGIAFHPNQEESFYVNSKDHVRIVSFKPGLNFKSVCNRAFDLDHSFQDSLQFAATNNFGYLTSSFYDVGSGMKLSFYAHLPSITFLGEIENIIQSIRERGLAIRAVHGVGGKWGDALGAYYEVSTISSFQGNELDQRATIESAAKFITKTERKFRKQCAENRTTEVANIILRSLSKGRFSLLLTLREAIDIISALKWGIDLKFGDGIDGSEIRTLIYHMQETHMQVLATTGSCKFEDDIKDNMNLQKDRLRAIVMQQTCEKIQFGE